MRGKAPGFWWREPGWEAHALSPLAALYGRVAGRRIDRAPRRPVGAPVLCVGNFTVGGSGKTPTAIALARAAIELGLKPGFLTRGHGGRGGPSRLVAPADDARRVGDEPLLLAAHAPVAVGADRARGAELLLAGGCDFLVMDDGFQSARVHVDFALVVVDRRSGTGNGYVLPAGPLRAPLARQMPHADALLLMGEGAGADPVIRRAARAGKPLFSARLVPTNPEAVRGRRVLAFSGLGLPGKFLRSVEQAGGILVAVRAFGDHHPYAPAELEALARDADAAGLDLVTTAKDRARLAGRAPTAFLDRLRVLEVEARFSPPEAAEEIVEATREAWRRRRDGT